MTTSVARADRITKHCRREFNKLIEINWRLDNSEGHAHPRESIVVVQRTVCEEITGPVTTSPSCQVALEAGPAGSRPAPASCVGVRPRPQRAA